MFTRGYPNFSEISRILRPKKNLLEAFRAARETFGPVVAVWALSRADTRHEKRDLSICCTTVVVIVSKLMAWLRDIYIYIQYHPIQFLAWDIDPPRFKDFCHMTLLRSYF